MQWSRRLDTTRPNLDSVTTNSPTSSLTAIMNFNTFHTATREVPFEVTSMIMAYVAADHACQLLGSPGCSLPAVSMVSSPIRSIYAQQCSHFSFKDGKGALALGRKGPSRPVRQTPIIGRTLHFFDLRAMASFFTDGPGRQDADEPRLNQEWLSGINFIRVEFRDTSWHRGSRYAPRTLDFAYEAFQLLAAAINGGRINACTLRLQIYIGEYDGFCVDTPGMWNLLKVSGLQALILDGYVDKGVRSILQSRVTSRVAPLGAWQPTGLESTGFGDWMERVLREEKGEGELWERQWRWLDN